METQVCRWGKGLAIRIPKTLAEEIGFEEGTPIDLFVEQGRLIIQKKPWTVEDLLAGITEENIHLEIDTGAPIGNEVW
jgi:antitoxin MazE